ncbi:MAG: UDP-N-acetylmuramoyl-L-alanyl-D-glutamate--2,6-diaminopimelate ligase [Nitrospinota bacterium]|nr:UDP-N-acetylmuramoyl-L-alanyl-D-glutamate--2,6-diaminopimelate ligase [Nitrospinota bacterium]
MEKEENYITLMDLSDELTFKDFTGVKNTKVSGISYDSRNIKSGNIFVAIKGFKKDGHRYVEKAIKSGASTIILESPIPGLGGFDACFVVDSGRRALAELSSSFFNHPSEKFNLFGVTGTNGKTTTVFLLDWILNSIGRNSGMLGTIYCRVGDEIISNDRTTPESSDLQNLFFLMAEKKVSDVCMEVSSHSLELDRVYGCNFNVALFTNLSQDHLDFHGDMSSYFASKMKLFDEYNPDKIVVNIDDKYGRKIYEQSKLQKWSYGLSEKADVRAEDICNTKNGLSFNLKYPNGSSKIQCSLIGAHNLMNILAASAASLSTGISAEEIAVSMQKFKSVPGRFEKIDMGQPFLVVVDYAHTQDALSRIIKFSRPITQGRILTLMGCGGDRDRTKRPLMCAEALRGSDVVVLTTDNPRNEVPEEIIREVSRGKGLVPGSDDRCFEIVDRKEAIQFIISNAKEGDTVLITGKGHETYQMIEEKRFPFDDRDEARFVLESLGYK